MGKGHRDNHAARKKRGPEAFVKKAARRAELSSRCNLCGSVCREHKLIGGVCPKCFDARAPAGMT